MPDSAPRCRMTFVLGKPARQDTVFPEVFRRLRAMRVHVDVVLPNSRDGIPEDILDASVVVQRGLTPQQLTRLSSVEAAGVRVCNPISASETAVDRVALARRLQAAAVPTPCFALFESWEGVLAQAHGNEKVVVKARNGRHGRGAGVLISANGGLPPSGPFNGPFILQEFVEGGDCLYKLYVSGPHVRGLLRSSSTCGRGVPFDVDDDIARIALAAGNAAGLEIFGVDVLYGSDGPTVIDVNPFPGFRGVPDAAHLIADHLGSLRA